MKTLLSLSKNLNLFGLSLLFIIINQFLIRLLEIYFIHFSFKITLINFIKYSLNFDSISLIIVSIAILPVFILINFLNSKISKILLFSFFSIIIITNTILSSYYLITLEPLTAVAFNFNLVEVIHIVKSEINHRNTLLTFNILTIIFSIFILYNIIFKFKIVHRWIYSILIIIVLSISIINIRHTVKDIKHFDSRGNYTYYNSKLALFLNSIEIDQYESSYSLSKQNELIYTFQKKISKKEHLSKEYPLLNSSSYKNVLGPLFPESNIKPNIIFIISESLSKTFVGENSKYNLATFSDSLSKNGLSWNNFFSNAEKSYGVLPSVLASLPNSLNKRGFINIIDSKKKSYPKYDNLINILNLNSYTSNYYYGGWGEFDHVSSWMKNSGVQNFIDQDKINVQNQINVQNEFIWGYNDSVLFKEVLNEIPNTTEPFVNVVQTLSLHSPFNLAPEYYFDPTYLSKRMTKLGLNIDSIPELSNNELACIIFADDALRHFFNAIKNEPCYSNTIFILTGDHGLSGGLIESPLDNYHVPLIIFSPLLKKHQTFKGVSSHVDITPSLLSLLKENYNITLPKTNHWIGFGLDTSNQFAVNNPVFFNLGRTDLPIALTKKGLYYGQHLYSIESNLEVSNEKSASPPVWDSLIESMHFINSYTIENNKIYK